MRRRTTPSLALSPDERLTLEAWAHGTNGHDERQSRQALRAKIVLACAQGLDATSVAIHTGVTAATVEKWRRRFVQDRLDGLQDLPRPGAPRKISSTQIEDVLLRTVEPTPAGARRWTRRDMARATGLSRSSIHRIWRRFDLEPRRRALPGASSTTPRAPQAAESNPPSSHDTSA
jgi:transposase